MFGSRADTRAPGARIVTTGSLVYVTDGSQLLAWDELNDGGYTPVSVLAVRVNDIAFAPDGSLWAVGGPLGQDLFRLDPATGQVLASFPTNQPFPLTGLTFSPDGRIFATAGISGGMFEFDTMGREVTSFDLGVTPGDPRSAGRPFGDTVVFNGELWSLTTRPSVARLVEFGLTSWNLATGLLHESIPLGDMRGTLPISSALPDGYPLDGMAGLAIGADGHLYLVAAGHNGIGTAMFRVYFDSPSRPVPNGEIIIEPDRRVGLALVEETIAILSPGGAAGAEDSRVAWSIGSDGADPLTAWSATTASRMHGHDRNDTLTGGALNDELYGDAGDDRLIGLGGSDDLFGGDGNDTLSGDADSDALQGGPGNDSLLGGDGSDVLADDGVGNDTMLGGAGNDVILAGAGDDQAQGDAGADHLYGGDGNDRLDGGLDNDSARGEAGNDTLLGADGNDELLGQDGQDSILGGNGNDRGWGGAGGDTLRGEAGNDLLLGEAGDDWLVGGAGADTLTGSTGADRFRFESRSDYYIAPTPFGPPVLNRYTPDLITDFAPAQADRIDLAALFDSFGATAGALTTAQLRAQGYLQVTQSGADALVRVDSNGATGGASFLTVAVVQATLASALTDAVFLT